MGWRLDCLGSQGLRRALSSGWGLQNDLESEVITPVFISYSVLNFKSPWPLGPITAAPTPHATHLSGVPLQLLPTMLGSH